MTPKLFFTQRIFLCLMIISSIYCTSCTTTRIVSKYDCDTIANNPLNKKTTWSFAWGLVQPKDINPKCDKRSDHMNGVTVKNNLGFALISLVTLGIVMPQHVEWCCAPYSPAPESLGNN